MEIITKSIALMTGMIAVGFCIGAGLALGYNYFKNKTKKVCDICFREIKAINAMVNKKKIFFDQEIVICSAIKTEDGLIIRGHRHCDCYHNLSLRPEGKDKLLRGKVIDGFITSRNQFVGREQAQIIQLLAGKKSNDPNGYHDNILYSEDLY